MNFIGSEGLSEEHKKIGENIKEALEKEVSDIPDWLTGDILAGALLLNFMSIEPAQGIIVAIAHTEQKGKSVYLGSQSAVYQLNTPDNIMDKFTEEYKKIVKERVQELYPFQDILVDHLFLTEKQRNNPLLRRWLAEVSLNQFVIERLAKCIEYLQSKIDPLKCPKELNDVLLCMNKLAALPGVLSSHKLGNVPKDFNNN